MAGAKRPALALGWLLFQCESGVTDRALDPEPAQRLRAHVEKVMLRSTGIANPSAAAALKLRLHRLLPQLNEARRAVASSCNQLQLPGMWP